jgi:hypothetical protein
MHFILIIQILLAEKVLFLIEYQNYVKIEFLILSIRNAIHIITNNNA